MIKQLLLKCTIAEFEKTIRDFVEISKNLGLQLDMKVYDDEVEILLTSVDNESGILGRLSALTVRGGNALITFDIDDHNWLKTKSVWERLYAELNHQRLIESSIDSREVNAPAIFEMKLQTDIQAFYDELLRFSKSYPRSDEVLDIEVAEFSGRGLFGIRPMDDIGASEPTRSWSIKLHLLTPSSHAPYWIDGTQFTISRIGGDHPLLLKILPSIKEARSFIRAFIDRCKQLWVCQDLSHTIDPEQKSVIDNKILSKLSHRPGRPGLDQEELFYRLSKAQEAEKIRSEDPDKGWKEIANDINWRHGNMEPGLRKLLDARKMLKSLKDDDPHNVLDKLEGQTKTTKTT